MRRYRLFLLVAVLSATTIYWLSVRNSWGIADLEHVGQTSFRHDLPQKPAVHQPRPVQEPPLVPAPPSPADDVLKAVDLPPAETSSRTILSTSSSVEIESTTFSAQKPVETTTIGEELPSTSPRSQEKSEEGTAGKWKIQSTPSRAKQPRWKKPKPHFPLAEEDIIELPSGAPKKLPKIQAIFGKEDSLARKDRLSKLNTVRESFQHAWNGYKRYGLPHDEVKPISKSNEDPFMGWGATLVDTLDTLWIMGLKQEFEEALVEVEKIDFQTSMRKDLPLFETVIRYLGGLIAAHDLTKGEYPVLLEKAEELAEILIGAFDTPNRMPMTFYNWTPSYTSQPHRASPHTVMAELGSLSVEMTRLAQITAKNEYYDAIARITNELEKWQLDTLMPGLWPLKLDASGCQNIDRATQDTSESLTKKSLLSKNEGSNVDPQKSPSVPKDLTEGYTESRSDILRRYAAADESNNKREPSLQHMGQEVLGVDCVVQGLAPELHAKQQSYGIGGQADSTYEYFPKMYALLRGREKQYETMYKDSMQSIRKDLLFRPMIKEKNRKILFTSKRDLDPKAKDPKKREITTYEVTHLSCFAGGMVGLGAKLFGIEEDLELAKQLTDGCVWAYESMSTGIMAEAAAVAPCPDLDVCAWNETRWHEALDPQRDERFSAVKTWNTNQKAIYEKSVQRANKDVARDAEIARPQQTSDRLRMGNRPEKRETSDEEPSATSPKLDLKEEKTERPENRSASLHFIPKVALSHEKYVQARIEEERLPSSYTNIFDRHYGLRPEAIESVFYMYRLTGDDVWRQKGWKMFEAVQSATQTEVANAAVIDVTSTLDFLDDKMESFWLAETLKYAYLLFDEPDRISLDDYVFNTEAHPLLIT